IPVAAHLGRTPRAVLGPVGLKIEPLLERVFSSGCPIPDFELSAQLPARTEVGYWLENYLPIKDQSGDVEQVGVLVVELTPQKVMHESLLNMALHLLHMRDAELRKIADELN